MTDDTEAIVASYTYDSFGNLIASSGATTNAYGFTGEQQFNEADNLVYLRARYYDPVIGRFISRDPLGTFIPMNNLYSYCRNNPVNYIDPSGLLSIPGISSIIQCVQAIADAVKDVTGRGRGSTHCLTSCNVAKSCGGNIADIMGIGWEYWTFLLEEWVGGGISESEMEDAVEDIVRDREGIAGASNPGGCGCACGGECKKCAN